MRTGLLVAIAGVLAAWLPVEVFPWAGVAVLGLLVINAGLSGKALAWEREILVPALAIGLWVAAGLTVGWDRATAASELGLAAVVAAVLWLASKRVPRAGVVTALSLGVSLLTLWAVWQVSFGLKADLTGVALLPEGLRGMARFKILTGRAFAALAQPGHLAVLLATVVPVAISRITAGQRRGFWAGILGSCLLGIVLTRSLLGAALAVLGLMLGWEERHSPAWKTALAVVLGCLVLVAVLRTDLTRLEPVRQRVENWKAAVWVWEGAPVTGVGLGGFGQAALGYPGRAANHPQHAHCLPLEWGAEMGVPGFGLALLFFLWVTRLSWRTWRTDRGLAVAVLIVPLHNLFDFSFFSWGVAIPWAVIAGWTVAKARDGEVRHSRPKRWGRPLLLAMLVSMMFVACLNAFASSLEQRAASDPVPSAALHLAELARLVAPWRLDPVRTISRAASENPALVHRALRDVEKAQWWRPHSPGLAMQLALLELAAHNTPGAMEEAARAAAYAPPGSGLEKMAHTMLSGQ